MPAFRLSAKTFDALLAIGRYTEENWGRAQRNKYLAMLDACFHTIAEQPFIGAACDHIRSGYRKYHVGRHLVFYRSIGGRIEIIRILHESMDIESHF